jgi:hypothetical protein
LRTVIVTVPSATPVTTPLIESTVATAKLLLLHLTPVAVSVSVVVAPAQTEVVPLIGETTGNGLMVIGKVVVTVLPQPITVLVMVTVPPETPVTTPVEELTVATEASLVLQERVPNVKVVFESVVEIPWQIVESPEIEPAVGEFEMTIGKVLVVEQPRPSVYVYLTVSKVPLVTPVTTPFDPDVIIVALAFVILHTPPAVASV